MNRAERDRLRAILRAADPAAGVDGPPPAEAARLRRAVLAPDTASSLASGWRSPGLRWATAAALAAALAVVAVPLLRNREEVLGPSAGPPVTRALPGAAETPATTTRGGEPRATGLDAAGEVPPAGGGPSWVASLPAATAEAAPIAAPPPAASAAGRHADPPARPAAAPAVAEPAAGETLASVPAPLARQIQVTAPGGTRIIWILTSATGP